MVRQSTLIVILVGLVLSWPTAYASDPDDCICQGQAQMFSNTLSGLRIAYRIFDDCLNDPLCPECSSNRELVFLHALMRSALLFIDNNDLVVNESFLELAGAFGVVVQGDSFDPCDTTPVDVNVLMNLDGCYRIPPGAPDLAGIRETLDYSIIPEIDDIVAELDTIADSEVSRFRVFFEPNETGLQEDLEADYGEVLILKGLLLGLKGFLRVQLAYDLYLDVNDARIDSLLFDEGICPNDVNSLELSEFIDINDPNGNLNINDDLPGRYPDLLKVLPTPNFPDVNGTAILAQSVVDLIAAVDYYLDALHYIVSEDDPPGTDPQEDELVYVDPNDRRFLDSINQKLIMLRNSLARDTVGVYPLETTKTYEVYNLSHICVGELVLLYDLFGIEGEGGNLSFTDGNSVPSPWEVEWFSIADSNQIQIGLARFSDGQWQGGYFEGAISPDCNTITGGTFEYWGDDSGDLSGLSAQHVGTDVLDGRLDLNPLFGGSGRYTSPVNPRDLLAEFDQKNEPISGTFGHGLGDDPTLGGIFPDMTQELWAILFDLPVPGLRLEEGFRFRVGEQPVSAAIGDLNGDGFLDVVTANAGSDDVSVLIGADDGGFLPEQYYTAGEQPASIALGDLNSDKILDIVVANEGSNDVSVLLGTGGGRFQRQSRHATGLEPSGVAVGDVTGDGIADIVTSNRGSSNVCVLVGVGNGDMRSPVCIAVGGGPSAVALGDLNGDGMLDIVTADDWACTISVLLALGDGHFDERRILQAGGGPSSVVIGDLNGDDALDIVAGNIWSDDVTVTLGNGDGTFETPTSFDTAEGQFSVALGDVNGDGVIDIVTANTWADEISVLLGAGDGTFGRRSGFDATYEPQCVLVGDLNSDGIAEILTANGWSNDVSVFVSRCATYGHYPSGSVPGPVGAVRFHFPQRMNTGSFTLEEDLGSFVGPDGPIQANGFLWIDAQTLEVRFVPQHKYGSYRMAIGPLILDGYGREMDADGDLLYGELIEDRYVGTFTILGYGDLVITSVEVQGHPTAGRKIAVSWDGLNADQENTIGQGFLDAVYLSANNEWDIDDIHVATIPHTEPLGPEEGYHKETGVVLPGVLPGEYYVVVRTDPGNQIDEPNGEDNNIGVSDPLVVDVNRLTVGEELIDGFATDERERYYSIDVSEGEDLEIRLDDLDNMGTNELYVGFERVPSRSSYDHCYSAKFAPDQTLTIPDTRAGTYYAMVYAAGMGGSGYSGFTIGARYLPMEIRAVDPNKGGNMSSLPLGVQIKGARFRSGATALLRRAGHTDIPATEVKVIDTSTIFAKFNLLGAAVGSWTMVVTNPDLDTATFPFEVFEGGNAKFEARLSLPDGLGFHIRSVLWIEYANSGDGPMLATLLKLHGSQNALLTADKSLDGEGLWTDSPPPGLTDTVQVLALGTGQDCGILNPGDSGRIPIYYRGLKLPWDWSRPPIEFRLGVLTAETTTPIDWAEVEEDIKPCDVNESDWNSMFARLRDRIGPTWADYVATLTDNARRRARCGVITYDVRELFTEEIREAYGEEGNIIAGHVYRSGGNGDVAGATVIASQVDGNEVSVATTDSDGRFIMQFVPAGTYDLTVQGYFLAVPAQAEVAEGVDPCSLELAVDVGGSISGYVRTHDYWWPDGASVTAVSATGEVFAATTDWGWYTINGVQPGTYTVRCEFESYVTEERSDVSIASGQSVWGIDFELERGGTITGTITASDSSVPIEAAQVIAVSENGQSLEAWTDYKGAYSVTGLSLGRWHILAGAPDYVPSNQVEVKVTSDGVNINFELSFGASIGGTVTEQSGLAIAGATVFAKGSDVSYGSGVTDDNGKYEITGLGVGEYEIYTIADGYVTNSQKTEVVIEGSKISGVDFQMQTGLMVQGAVTEVDGKTPVAGAALLFRSNAGGAEVVIAGADGTFRIDTLTPSVYYLRVWKDGYSVAQRMMELSEDGMVSDVNTSLCRGAALTGVVREADGVAEVPDVSVHLYTLDRSEVSTTFTDTNGRYDFGAVPPGIYSVELAHRQFSFSSQVVEIADTGDITCDFRAASGGIYGIVTSAETESPVLGARVTAILKEPHVNLVMSAETEADGSYSLSSLRHGDYTITCLADDFGRQLQEVTVSVSGEKVVDFALGTSLTVSGTVVDSGTGTPIERASVWLVDFTHQQYDTGLFAIVDGEGKYTISGLSPAQYMVRAQAEKYAIHETKLTVAEDTTMDIALVTDGYTVSGNVVDVTTKLPIAGATVIISRDRYLVGYVESNGDGVFSFRPVSAGEYDVAAFPMGGYRTQRISVVGDTNVDVACSLNPLPDFAVVYYGLSHSPAGEMMAPLSALSAAQATPNRHTFTNSDCPWWLSWLPSRWCKLWQNAKRLPNDPWEYKLPPVADCPDCLHLRDVARLSINQTNNLFNDWDLSQRKIRGVVLRDGTIVWLRGIQTACDLISGVFGGWASQGAKAKACLEQFLHVKQVSELRREIDMWGYYVVRLGSTMRDVGRFLAETNFTSTNAVLTDGAKNWKLFLSSIDKASGLLATAERITGSLGAVGDFINCAIHACQTWNEFRYRANELKNVWDDEEKAHRLYEQWVWKTIGDIHGYQNCLKNCQKPPDPNTDPIDGGDANSVGSFDPNKKLGPRGFGSGRYVRPGASMVYTVQFENEPNATAAAKKVRIVDQLDEDLDWTSFELLEVGFGPHNIVMPKGVSHHRTKTMIDGWTYRKGQGWSQNGVPMLVEVEAELDVETGQAVWAITAYDTETGWEPQDAYAGFLPPDDQEDVTHRGEGYVRFLARAKDSLPVGTQIKNSASIVFDVNPAIETPETVNTILIDRGDLDLSGGIDLHDVALLVSRWLWVGPLGAVDQDIAVDGVVNFLDFAAMVEK